MAEYDGILARVADPPIRVALAGAPPAGAPPVARVTPGGLRRVLSPLVAQALAARMAQAAVAWDVYDGGHHRIHGTVTVERTPARRRVRLFDARTGRLLRAVWSAADGRYAFDFLAAGRDYVVIAHDHERQFNAVVADAVQPEPMP
jgi:hypothetical protein